MDFYVVGEAVERVQASVELLSTRRDTENASWVKPGTHYAIDNEAHYPAQNSKWKHTSE